MGLPPTAMSMSSQSHVEHFLYDDAANEAVDFTVASFCNGVQRCQVSRNGGPFQLNGRLKLCLEIS